MTAHLSPRELQVLAALVQAGSAAAASARIRMPLATFNAHLRNIRSKHGEMTTVQIVRVHSAQLPLPNGIVKFDE